MFDFVHKNKRVIQIFLGLIALTFATWGIESYTRMRGGRDTVATVNGLEISARELDDELRRRNDQLRQALGGNYDPSQFDTPEMRRGLLESLVSQRLVASAAYRAHLTVSDEALLDAARLARHVGAQHLDRHGLAQLAVEGLVDHAHAAAAERPEDLVARGEDGAFRQRGQHGIERRAAGEARASAGVVVGTTGGTVHSTSSPS